MIPFVSLYGSHYEAVKRYLCFGRHCSTVRCLRSCLNWNCNFVVSYRNTYNTNEYITLSVICEKLSLEMRTLSDTSITKETFIESRETFCLAVNCSWYGTHKIGSTAGRLRWFQVDWAKLGLLILPNCLCCKQVFLELHYAKPDTLILIP